MAKGKGGFLGHDGIDAPDAPTGVEGSAGDGQVNVSFTTPADVGGAPITEYRVTDSTGAHGATGSSSPVTVTGLTNGTEYTFNVWAINPFGWSSPSGVSGGISPVATKGVFVVISNPTGDEMQQIEFATTGNATNFGDLNTQVARMGGCSSATRGIFGGGQVTNAIQYIAFASAGNATDFGDLTIARQYLQGASNETRGLFGGGTDISSNLLNTIDYVTIASTGNASDFGDLTENQGSKGGNALASPTRAVFAGGDKASNTKTDTINYVTISSTGDASDFGNLIEASAAISGCSNSTRGLWAGGYPDPFTDRIEYITIASTGNATDFGDLTANRAGLAAMASSTRAVFACGNEQGVGNSNRIDYVTIASAGNATDFGDALGTTTDNAGVSSGHGGLA